MTILAVDGNSEYLASVCDMIAELEPDAEILSFCSSPKALAQAREKEIDTAFLNPAMPEISGIIAMRIRRRSSMLSTRIKKNSTMLTSSTSRMKLVPQRLWKRD